MRGWKGATEARKGRNGAFYVKTAALLKIFLFLPSVLTCFVDGFLFEDDLFWVICHI